MFLQTPKGAPACEIPPKMCNSVPKSCQNIISLSRSRSIISPTAKHRLMSLKQLCSTYLKHKLHSISRNSEWIKHSKTFWIISSLILCSICLSCQCLRVQNKLQGIWRWLPGLLNILGKFLPFQIKQLHAFPQIYISPVMFTFQQRKRSK